MLDAVQQRLDANPEAMRQRRETVEYPFGTMNARMGATHFLTKTLPKVAAEMALSVLAYSLTRAATTGAESSGDPLVISATTGIAGCRARAASGHAAAAPPTSVMN